MNSWCVQPGPDWDSRCHVNNPHPNSTPPRLNDCLWLFCMCVWILWGELTSVSDKQLQVQVWTAETRSDHTQLTGTETHYTCGRSRLPGPGPDHKVEPEFHLYGNWRPEQLAGNYVFVLQVSDKNNIYDFPPTIGLLFLFIIEELK